MTTPANPDDLTDWLRRQLDEDVRGIHEWIEPREDGLLSSPLRPVHQLTDRVGAQRMWAEVDAKRRILDEHPVIPEPYGSAGLCERCVDSEAGGPDPAADYPCRTVRLLALPYADRPGYREEWRP